MLIRVHPLIWFTFLFTTKPLVAGFILPFSLPESQGEVYNFLTNFAAYRLLPRETQVSRCPP